MKKIILIFLTCYSSLSFSQAKMPEFFFQYSFLFERLCPESSSNIITDEQKKFARFFSKEASILYNDEVIGFFDFLEESFPKSGFSRNELTANLTLCKEFGSFSTPLTINIFRVAAHKLKNPLSNAYQVMFTETLFHELIHTWQGENFNFRKLKFVKKYENEVKSVRAHLYLLAIEEYTFRGLSKDEHLERIQWLYPKIGGAYKRAWEIVQKEGYMAFIEDLRLNQKL